MSDVIVRPRFAEGQILAAADLEAAQSHASDQLARHERALHDWGIAAGLALTGADRATADPTPIPYKDVTLGAGMAVDGTGREIVVPADLRLAEADFLQSNVASGPQSGAWFPVFLIGRDVLAAASGGTPCGASSGGRMQEGYLIQFGRPGDAATLGEQVAPPIGSGPGSQAWRVLLGFVQWNGGIGGGKFIDVAAVDDQGTTVRYAGVRADLVSARGDSMLLTVAAGAPGSGGFTFGVRGASGTTTPVLTIAANGDVTATGKLVGAPTPGTGPGGIKVQSGTAWDGIILPLPPGVTAEMIAPGKGTLHVHLTPRIAEFPLGVNAGDWIASATICELDADRRLHCTLKFYDLGPPAKPRFVPGACEYLIVAEIVPGGG